MIPGTKTEFLILREMTPAGNVLRQTFLSSQLIYASNARHGKYNSHRGINSMKRFDNPVSSLLWNPDGTGRDD